MPCWWHDVISSTNLTDESGQREKAIILASMLFYISPWLLRWRGTQLPIEMMLGEAGSGKSSLYEHRLNILTGSPQLRNSPTGLRDWYASISSTGGLHVTDNVATNNSNKQLRQAMSDEMCRIVTAPNPTVEMRELYSTANTLKLPISTTFALTALRHPFSNTDLLQRSILLKMDKTLGGTQETYDPNWVRKQMASRGGREAWLAHHLCVLRQFFLLVTRQWDMNYKAAFRLINVEQSLILMGKVFGQDLAWIPDYLSTKRSESMIETDWCLRGLITWSTIMYKQAQKRKAETGGSNTTNKITYGAKEIAEWAAVQEGFTQTYLLTNSRSLSSYLRENKQRIASTAGIIECGTSNNRKVYTTREDWTPPEMDDGAT